MTDTLTVPLPHAAPRTHEHGWTAESRHPTSEGVVVYVRCAGCGARRVDVVPLGGILPNAASRPVSGRA